MAFTGQMVFGHGDASVEIDDETRQLVADVLDRLAPAVLDRFEEVTKEIEEAAIAEAPVKTGNYRDSITRGLRVTMDSIEGFVEANPKRNGRSYAWAIRMKWPNTNKKVVNESIFKPGKKAGKALAEDLADALQRLAGGGRV